MIETEIDIRGIAHLARLHVEESELAQLKDDFGAVLRMVQNLPEDGTAMAETVETEMQLRHDIAEECVSNREVLLKNAPLTQNGCFVVPKTVE